MKTAVILILIIDFMQMLGNGKEYGHLIKLVTGLLVACSLCGGILQITGSLTEDTWLSWLTGEEMELESIWEGAAKSVGTQRIQEEEEDANDEPEEKEHVEENDAENTENGNIKVPIVEDIPRIEVDQVQISD
ncbi:MAG: hypothetical protein LUH19_04280 [Lachnospiraceae bacterium]|nr:hypothetical protein [Lachnospiraceae bacterium]